LLALEGAACGLYSFFTAACSDAGTKALQYNVNCNWLRLGTAVLPCLSSAPAAVYSRRLPHAFPVHVAPCYSGNAQVSAHQQCVVRIEILNKPRSAGNLFIVQGIAVIPYTDAPLLTPLARLLLEPAA
jgi:hypothetical protein